MFPPKGEQQGTARERREFRGRENRTKGGEAGIGRA